MFYASLSCPTCEVGTVGFCRCADDVTLGLICERCDTFYRGPEHLTANDGHYPPHSAARTPEGILWARQEEIELRGWGQAIVGELVVHPG